MKDMTIYAFIYVALLVAGCSYGGDGNLPDKLIDVTLSHIHKHGPDEDAAQFISMEGFASWERREEIADVTIPYLKSKNSDDVAGALAVLYRLRSYRPLSDRISVNGSAWEKKYKPGPFWSKLDEHVIASLEHFHSVGTSKVFHNLALYLGAYPSPESKQELLRIANETSETAQALICLTHHRDTKDMDSLLPFMLEDPPATRSLPYLFRKAYGVAAAPYLRKAIAEAKSEAIRQKAEKELKILHGHNSTFIN